MTRYLLILFAAIQLHAASYYVATNGNDGAAGSIGAPWATVTHALATVAGGDTINCFGGSYTNETWPIGIAGWPSGSDEAHRTLLTSYSGIASFLPQAQDQHGVYFHDVQWITLSNVVVNLTNNISTSQMSCVRIDGTSHHIRIVASELCGAPDGHGVHLSQATCYSNEVLNCRVHDLGWNFPGEPSRYDHGFYVRTSSNVFAGNRIWNMDLTNGVLANGGRGIKISEGDDIHGNMVYNNLCYSNAVGIGVNQSDGGHYVWNNVVCYNSQWGIQAALNIKGTVFAHNTVFSNALGNFFIQDRLQTNWFINNVSAFGSVDYDDLGGGYGIRTNGTGDKLYIWNALSYNNKSGIDLALMASDVETNLCLFCGTTNIVEQFVDPSRSAMNFQLLLTSLAVDRGVAITGLPEPVQTLIGYDYLGHARPTGSAPDIGAYEYPQVQSSLVKLKNLKMKLIKLK